MHHENTFTSTKRHYRNDRRYYDVVVPNKSPILPKWPGLITDYVSRPVQFQVRKDDLGGTGILKNWDTSMKDPEKEMPVKNGLVNMYILEDPHLLWEQQQLKLVAVEGHALLCWARGSGDPHPRMILPNDEWLDPRYDEDEPHLTVFLNKSSKKGRWCCCKRGQTERSGCERHVGHSHPLDYLKPKRMKSKRNLNPLDWSNEDFVIHSKGGKPSSRKKRKKISF